MSILDVLVLSHAKRKAHSVRNIVVVLASSLLFAIFFFITFPLAGIEKTVQEFRSVGLNDHYFATVAPYMGDSPLIDYRKLEQQVITDGMAKGKSADDVKKDPNIESEVSRRAAELSVADFGERKDAVMKRIKSHAGTVALYEKSLLTAQSATEWSGSQADQDIATAKTVSDLKQKNTNIDRSQMSFEGDAQRPTISMHDPKYLREVIQYPDKLAYRAGQPIPAVIAMPLAEKLSGIKMLGVEAKDRIATGKRILSAVTDKELFYCYRNEAAVAQLTEVVQYNYAAETDKDPKTLPLPLSGCSDMDQSLLKKAGIASAQPVPADAPKTLFPQPVRPRVVSPIHIKVAGVVSVNNYTNPPSSIVSIVSFSLNDSSIGMYEILVPNTAASELSFTASDALASSGMGNASWQFVVDMRDEASLRKLADEGCALRLCNAVGKDAYSAIEFGNFGYIVGVAKSYILTFFSWVGAIVAAIFVVITMLNIGKVVGDGRREIAIFRAIGARRWDILQIYLAYAARLGVDTSVVAVLFGAAIAFMIRNMYEQPFTVELVSTLGDFTTMKQADLFELNVLYVGAVAVAIVGSSVLGAVVPIAMSVRKHMLKQLREE